MDPAYLSVAFILGFLARQISLPPMIGFLVAGFILKSLGVGSTDFLTQLAEVGVTLLLFSIGLKLKLTTLARPEVWAGSTLHMAATTALISLLLLLFSPVGVGMFEELNWVSCLLIAFAFSFSSTVFAIKALEEKGELTSLHGRVVIGILVMQDVVAVVFITLSAGKVPSIWALGLLALPLARPLFYAIMNRCGHGELVPLFGLFAALVLGAELFKLVGLKPDLGALLLGVLLSRHPRAGEVSESLLSFKDILLIGFFLNIGLAGSLTLEAFLLAVFFSLLLPLKAAGFFYLLTRFKLRARSSSLSALTLSNYSEFGLIVGAIGVSSGLMPAEWLTVIALSLAISFVVGSPLNTAAHSLYARFHEKLMEWEHKERLPDDQPIVVGNARILILGMGRVGAGAYDTMKKLYGDVVIGLEGDAEKIPTHQALGRRVVHGDATDSDFWERLPKGEIVLVMVTLPELGAKLDVIEQLQANGYDGRIVAAARFADDMETLEAAGVDWAADTFREAGTGFADDVAERFSDELLQISAAKG
ncbi:MAG: cation:proton antiporter [Filomicrobium sp.]